MTDPAILPLCGCRRGVFLLTPCVNPAAAGCSGCGIPLCREHTRLRGGAPFCPQCYGIPDHDDDWDRSRSSSTSYGTGDWGNATDDTVSNQTDGMAEPFTAEDYAAFDAVSDFDKNAGIGDGYDS